MLLRRTSVMSGAKTLALAGLLGWASVTTAQQPPLEPRAVAQAGSLAVGAVVGDAVGMIALPIRAAAEAPAGKGTICGRLILGTTGVANKSVYLVEGGKIVASARTDADGDFDLSAPRAGEYTFMAGPFDANGVVRKLVRLDAAEGATQAVVLQQKGGAPPAALAGGTAAPESVLNPIGNKASGNVDVTFVNGRFVANGQPVSAGNEYANLENGSFRGIVTALDDAGVRSALPGANLYLIRRGQVVGRTVSGVNGGFTFTNLMPGGYTLLATVGGYGTAEVALNGVPGVDQDLTPVVAPVAVPPYSAAPVAPVPSPYFAGMTAGVPGAVAVRFPFQAIAVQRIALRDGMAPPAGVSAIDAEFRMEGADEVLVKVAFCQPDRITVAPVVNLTPAPWEDLRLFIGTATFDAPPVGLVPTPAADFVGGGGGFAGGGGGGGGFGGAGALAGLAAAAAIAAGAGGGGGGGGGGGFASPLRP
jgi:hypothetical protein